MPDGLAATCEPKDLQRNLLRANAAPLVLGFQARCGSLIGMTPHDLYLLLLGAVLEVTTVAAIVFVPELLDYLQALMSRDSWPGER
jgi:hypothetical protein